MYLKVLNNAVVGSLFTLAKDYKKDDGTVVQNIHLLSTAEKIELGLYQAVIAAHEAWETVPAYTINADHILVNYSAMPLADYKQQAISAVYSHAKNLLDAQAEGYSLAEIATWPAIQFDVIAYNANNAAIGSALQSAVDTSAYTVAELSAALTPRITMQISVIANRAALVGAINTAADHAAVKLININTGW